MIKPKNILYIVLAVFAVAVIAAASILARPRGPETKFEEYLEIYKDQEALPKVPEFGVSDEFRKESISEF